MFTSTFSKKILLIYFTAIVFVPKISLCNAFDEFIESHNTHCELEKIKTLDGNAYKKTVTEIDKVRQTYDQFSEHIENDNMNLVKLQLIEDEKIPKTLNFIWLGPKDFPLTSQKKLSQWIELHPDFEIFFWTDRIRLFDSKNLSKIKFKYTSDFFKIHGTKYQKMVSLYSQSKNFGEKSDILRYMILNEIGGVYLDHDIRPLRSIAPLVDKFSFFCFSENIWPMVNKHYFKISNAFIATAKNHRIISETINNIEKNWDYYTDLLTMITMHNYTVEESNLTLQLVLFRTFLPFTLSVKSANPSPKDLILPPQFFSLKHNNSSVYLNRAYVDHSFDNSWTTDNPEKSMPKNKRSWMKKIQRKSIKTFNISILILSILVINLIVLIFYLRKVNKNPYHSSKDS